MMFIRSAKANITFSSFIVKNCLIFIRKISRGSAISLEKLLIYLDWIINLAVIQFSISVRTQSDT
jgi:hypothetical protein